MTVGKIIEIYRSKSESNLDKIIPTLSPYGFHHDCTILINFRTHNTLLRLLFSKLERKIREIPEAVSKTIFFFESRNSVFSFSFHQEACFEQENYSSIEQVEIAKKNTFQTSHNIIYNR